MNKFLNTHSELTKLVGETKHYCYRCCIPLRSYNGEHRKKSICTYVHMIFFLSYYGTRLRCTYYVCLFFTIQRDLLSPVHAFEFIPFAAGYVFVDYCTLRTMESSDKGFFFQFVSAKVISWVGNVYYNWTIESIFHVRYRDPWFTTYDVRYVVFKQVAKISSF